MPETPKQKAMPVVPDEKDRSNWSEDQQTRGYYYDDAHGYEIYNPAEDEDESETGDEQVKTG